MMNIDIPYYEDKSRINNTAIGWFLNQGPSYFRKKMSGEIPDEESRAMSRGTMIHMYLLQPDEFKERYKVATVVRPKSTQQNLFCSILANSVEIEPDLALLDAYKQVYSIVGKSEAKMLSEAKEIASTLNSYIESIKDTKHIYISQNDMKMLESIRFNIDQHRAAKPLLDDPDAHHEFHINWDFPTDDGRALCKSLLDSVKFDTEKKECTIMDLKTTIHIHNFEKSVEEYDYFRQFMFYRLAAEWYIRNELHQDSKGWTFRVYIIAIDTVSDNEVRVFEFTPEQLKSRFADIKSVICDIMWCVKTGNWAHTRDYYRNNGIEYLNL